MKPSLLTPSALEMLEFQAIIEELIGYCLTEGGARYTATLPVYTQREKIDQECLLVVEWRSLLEIPEILLGLVFPGIAATETQLHQGAALSVSACAELLRFLRSSRLLAQRIIQAQPHSQLAAFYADLPDLFHLERVIDKVISEEGVVRVEALPTLQALRKRADTTLKELRQQATDIMRRHLDWYSSDQPPVRNGRIVLPLKADHHREMSAIRHSESDSGATIFVEPQTLVAINNRWIKDEAHYQRELTKLLAALSAELAASSKAISNFRIRMDWLDSLYARACYSHAHRCSTPQSSDTRSLILLKARHPLLIEAVPIDITISPPDCLLIICGPNAGGKSVTLKTIALILYMYHCGMEVPVEPGSQIPVADAIFLVMGDQQSIHDARSSFSAQMSLVAQLINRATSQSVILLDEIGSNTDPTEGAALAQAIMEECRRRSALTVATTHLPLLKEYAISTPHVRIAAMEFNPQSLQPTYRILPNSLESSHAHSLAVQAGLPPSIVSEAQSYLKDKDRQRELRLGAILSAEREIACERTELDERQQALNIREQELIGSRVGELEQMLKEARRLLERLSSSLLTNNQKTELKKERLLQEELQRGGATHAQQLAQARKAGVTDKLNSHYFEVGDQVRIKKNGMIATIIAQALDNHWEVQCNSIRIRLAVTDLERIGEKSEPTAATFSFSKTAAKSQSLDVRGLRVAEIEARVLKHIDDMCCCDYTVCEIIHGIGGGAVRAEVGRLLNEHPQVEHWEYAAPNQGGRGKTVVTLQ